MISKIARDRNFFRSSLTTIFLSVGLAVAPSAFAQDAPPPTPAAPPASPGPPTAPQSHRMPMMHRFSYTCDGGATLVVFLREQNARVTFNEKSYAMKQTMSGSGTRYSAGKMVWWSKGNTGFMDDESDADHPVHIATNCNLDHSSTANATSVVSGTVAYRERIAMPENALLTVQLQDVSLADAPAVILAEQKITFAGKQVPLAFELNYDPAKIDPKHTYTVSARIVVNGDVKFLNTSAYRVITQGNPVKVNLVLQSATQKPANPTP